MLHLDSTAINDFRKCPEYYRSRHVHGLRLSGSAAKGPLDAGSCLHAGIEVYYNTESIDEALRAMSAQWGPVVAHPLHVEQGKYTLAHLREIMRAYADAYPIDENPWKVVQNEQYFAMDMGDWVYHGVRDRVLTNGELTLLKDTKTTSFASKHLAVEYQLSTQLRGYVCSLRREGLDIDGALVDHVFIDTRGKKVKPEHFRRVEVLFTEEQLCAWERDATAVFKELSWRFDNVGEAFRWPQHDRRCFDYFKPCPFLARCHGSDPNAMSALDPITSQWVTYEEDRWDPRDKLKEGT